MYYVLCFCFQQSDRILCIFLLHLCLCSNRRPHLWLCNVINFIIFRSRDARDPTKNIRETRELDVQQQRN
jgi:hypothetical protein